MVSMNGIRMWKPAWRVPRYLPSRSTTYADCCGTTTAVRAMTTTTSPASTSITRSAPVIVVPPSLGSYVQHQPLDALDHAATSARQQLGAIVADRPGRAAQLSLADGARRQVVEQDRDVADQPAGHGGVAGCAQPLDETPAEEHERGHRQHREEEPLEPRRPAQPDTGERADDERGHAEEEDEEAAGRQDLDPEKPETEEDPPPPRHARPAPYDARWRESIEPVDRRQLRSPRIASSIWARAARDERVVRCAPGRCPRTESVRAQGNRSTAGHAGVPADEQIAPVGRGLGVDDAVRREPRLGGTTCHLLVTEPPGQSPVRPGPPQHEQGRTLDGESD